MKLFTIVMAVMVLGVWGRPRPLKRPDRMVDMTYPLQKDFPYHPLSKRFRMEVALKGLYPVNASRNAQYFLAANTYTTAEHGGTHFDAPYHFCSLKYCWFGSEVPIDRFIAPGVIVNVKEKAKKDRNYALTVQDLKDYEAKYGEIPDGAYVLMNSGWQQYVNNETKYLGVEKNSWPGFHENATKWLVDYRNIKGLGTDTISIDIGPSARLMSHRLALHRNIIALENVANLDDVPASGATIFAFPIPMVNSTGGQMRMIAMWDDDEANGSPSIRTMKISLLTVAAAFWRLLVYKGYNY